MNVSLVFMFPLFSFVYFPCLAFYAFFMPFLCLCCLCCLCCLWHVLHTFACGTDAELLLFHFPSFDIDLVDLDVVADADIGELLVAVFSQGLEVFYLLIQFEGVFNPLLRVVREIREEFDAHHAE